MRGGGLPPAIRPREPRTRGRAPVAGREIEKDIEIEIRAGRGGGGKRERGGGGGAERVMRAQQVVMASLRRTHITINNNLVLNTR